jgi:hypothetical protein
MGWINSDDMLTPWSLKTIAEIFSKFPHVHWIHGTNSWWNRQGQMIRALQTRKNIYDYLPGDYAWIQQESVFWRRSLWDKAGGAITIDFHFMVDGELWSRFFLFDELYTVDCILSGYRMHGGNRAIKNYGKCMGEMQAIIEIMETKCNAKLLQNAQKIKKALKARRLPLVSRMIGASYAPIFIGRALGENLLMESGCKTIAWDAVINDWIENRHSFR